MSYQHQHCNCGHDHEHEHDHEQEEIQGMDYDHPQPDKFHQAFNQFGPSEKDDMVTKKVNDIIEAEFKDNFNDKVLKKIHGFIDLTSLTSLDTRESILKMVDKVNDFEGTSPEIPNVAAICVYPIFVSTVKQGLTAANVNIAAVSGGFPASQTFTEVKIAETSLCVSDGADEIDVVMNLGYLLEDDYEAISDELNEIKESCREAKLKVILETGAIATASNIWKASICALYSGADFLKTSTGKGYPGASVEAAFVMCEAIKKYYTLTNRKVGLKVAGGIRSAEEAVKYYSIVKSILGEEWLNKDLFRIGASSLVGDIEHRLGIN
jgi:deoxyribose-phosphate aldolase